MFEPYGDPVVDAIIPEIREYIVANFMDGDCAGLLTILQTELADTMAEIVAVWYVERTQLSR